MQENGKITLSQFVLIILIISPLLFPPIGRLFNVLLRIEDIICLCILPLLFSYQPKAKKNILILLYLLHLFSIVWSMFYGYIFLDVPFSQRDLRGLIKYSQYLFVIWYIFHINTDHFVKKISPILVFSSFFILSIASVQYFDLFSLAEKTGLLYGAKHHVDAMIAIPEHRIVITGQNSHTGSILALFLLIFNFITYQYKRKILNLILSLLLFLALLSTGTRVTLFAFALFVVLALFVGIKTAKFRSNILLFTSIAILLAFSIPFYDRMTNRLSHGLETLDRERIRSFAGQARRGKWDIIEDQYKQSKIFGWGPAKGIFDRSIDSDYLLILRRGGIVGLAIIMFYIYYVPIKFIKNRKLLYFKSKDYYLLGLLTFYFGIVGSVTMLTSPNFYSGSQAFLLYIIVSTLVYKEMKQLLHSRTARGSALIKVKKQREKSYRDFNYT